MSMKDRLIKMKAKKIQKRHDKAQTEEEWNEALEEYMKIVRSVGYDPLGKDSE